MWFSLPGSSTKWSTFCSGSSIDGLEFKSMTLSASTGADTK